LALHRRQELRVERIDVDVVALVRPGADALELDLGLGQPGSQVRDEVADGPVRIVEVAGNEALLRGQRADQVRERVPAGTLGLELGGKG
jgi:hypothetical protein